METQNSQLTDFEDQVEYTPASAGQRFANLLIDNVIYYLLIFVLVFGVLFTTKSQEFADRAENDLGMQYLISFGVYFLYYFLVEYSLKGRTIGKFITGTRAIRVTGENITAPDAMLRSLIRLIPFEPFSFLGAGASGWHDRWTKTAVVKVQK